MSAALCLPGIDTLPPERLRQVALSQWFTPEETAARIAAWVGRPQVGWRLLEPSAGHGSLVRAMLNVSPSVHVDALDIDPACCDALRSVNALGSVVNVECCDYLTRPAPRLPYDQSVLNPPYEGGLDSAFVAKAMAESKRVVALVRLAMLETQRTYERVWSQVQSGDWVLHGMAVFVRRPVFLAAGEESDGGKTAFAAIKLSRVYGDRQERETRMEWWT